MTTMGRVASFRRNISVKNNGLGLGRQIGKFVVLGVLIFVCNFSVIYGVRPFGLAVLLLSYYLSFGIVAPVYLLTSTLANPSMQNVIVSILQCGFVLAMSFAKLKNKRAYTIPLFVVVVLIGMVGVHLDYGTLTQSLLYGTLVGAFFWVCFLIAGLGVDDFGVTVPSAAIGAVTVVFGMGMYALPHIGQFVYVFLGILLILFFSFKPSLAFYVGVALGVGSAIQSYSLLFLGLFAVLALGVCFANGKIQKIIATLASVTVYNLYFGQSVDYGMIVCVFFAVLCYLVVPQKLSKRVESTCDTDSIGFLPLMRQHNLHLESKQRNFVDALYSLQTVMQDYCQIDCSQDRTDSVVCQDQEVSTRQGLTNAMGSLVACVHDAQRKTNLSLMRDSVREQGILEQLDRLGIKCNFVIFASKQPLHYYLSLRVGVNQDIRAELQEFANANKVYIDSVGNRESNVCVVSIKQKAEYDLICAATSLPKKSLSGDSYSFVRLGLDKFVVVLCDGMGSGQQAHKISQATVALVNSFKKANLDTIATIQCINKFLTTGQEIYACLDIAIVDLLSGAVEMIKLGTPESYIRQANATHTIKSESLPLGMIEEFFPIATTKHLKTNDLIVFVTDGISDCFAEQELAMLVDCYRNLTPQELSNAIMDGALARLKHERDDMSVVVVKTIGV